METYLMECVESMLKSRRLHETRAVVERGSAVRATFDGQLRRTCATTQTTNADHKRRRTLQRGIAVVATDYRSYVQFALPSISTQCSVTHCLLQPSFIWCYTSRSWTGSANCNCRCRICLRQSADDWRLFTRTPTVRTPEYFLHTHILSVDTDVVRWH